MKPVVPEVDAITGPNTDAFRAQVDAYYRREATRNFLAHIGRRGGASRSKKKRAASVVNIALAREAKQAKAELLKQGADRREQHDTDRRSK